LIGDGLGEYKRKREFQEDGGTGCGGQKKTRARKTPANRFIIQNMMPALAVDFRLEMDGVFKSWAVPKDYRGHSRRHLAVEVEDHPIDTADFEGIIPKAYMVGGTRDGPGPRHL